MTRTKTIALVSGAVLLIAAVVAVKMIFFPAAKDAWFQLNQRALRQAPKGVVIVRPTHFPNSPQSGTTFANRWMVGRNVTFKRLIADAYGENPGLIWLPPDAPKNNFDFLVTALSGQQEQLRRAVQKKTGYTAQKEMHDADVLALKITDRTLPGMKESGADEKTGQSMKNGRLYLTHQKITDIVNPITSVLGTPVVDETGLTGFYDFSLAWNNKIQQGNLSQDDVEGILNEWGLGLEPDTASIEMLVVEKTK